MGTLRFDAVDDRLEWTTLASVLANVSDGAWTMAILVKRDTPISTLQALSYLASGSGAGVLEAGLNLRATDGLQVRVDAFSDSTTTFTSTASPYMFVISKGAGTVAPRLGWKLGSGGAWAHENFTGTIADGIASTMLEIGSMQDADFADGWIGVVAYWEGAMSDVNKEALDDNWRTSDLWNSAHGQPKFLAELNVAGASVVDLAGNASALTATGTTLDAAETLDSWNFNGVGASATTEVLWAGVI